ncbi:MAG: nitrate oxidoreductase subunit beta, partial [Planctomycetes bacterium]|nr:nitrate oxidoreductase subunit beta [Planctomycetota bacterium]
IIARYKIEHGPKVYETQVNGKKFEMYNDTVIAYNRADKEIFRTDVEEPVYVRPAKHANTI